jgi:hypothetical protein
MEFVRFGRCSRPLEHRQSTNNQQQTKSYAAAELGCFSSGLY